MPRKGFVRSGRIVLASIALAAMGVQPAAAATLGQILESFAGNPGRSAPCLRNTIEAPVPAERPTGNCAANIVGGLYVGLMRDRERLLILRAAISRQRALLDRVQSQIESGRASSGDSLLAEIELNRWQIEETKLVGAILHAELFFAAVLESEPSQMVRPRLSPSAWPEDEAAALVALAQEERLPKEALEPLQNLLQHAWIDYRAAKREFTLLQPMTAFARDLVNASQNQYEVGQIGLAALQDRYRDSVLLQDAEVNAEHRLLAIQLQILELLDRRSAIE